MKKISFIISILCTVSIFGGEFANEAAWIRKAQTKELKDHSVYNMFRLRWAKATKGLSLEHKRMIHQSVRAKDLFSVPELDMQLEYLLSENK